MKGHGPHLSVVPEPPGADPELERYFAAARELAEPDAQSRARVRQALEAAVLAPPVRGGASPQARSPAGLLGWPRAGSWLALGGVVIGALGFGLGHVTGRAELEHLTPSVPAAAVSHAPGAAPGAPGGTPPTSAAPTEPAPETPTATETAAAAPSDTIGAAPARSRTPVRAHRKARAHDRFRERESDSRGARARSPGLSFRQVLEQLERAREQLANGQATMSLLVLSELERGAGELLFEEREVTRVLALCAAGQTLEARAAAERLERRSPRSIYAMRLSASCIHDGDDTRPLDPKWQRAVP